MDDSIELLREALAGRYRIESECGRGGSAIVLHAIDLQHDRPVAIKVMRAEYALAPDRFLREIRILAGLQHPLIVPLFDSGRADDIPWFAMPFVEGESLRQRLQSTDALSADIAIQITLEVAEALAYAHARGFVHRDVKPENILLSAQHAMLSDFGIARAVERSLDSHATGSGVVLGTPAYMSPEQALEGEADHRSDQYSLACVAWEMLAGESPIGRGTPRSTLMRAAAGDLPDLRARRPDVPRNVAAAITRALSRNPEDRFDNVAAFAAALAGNVVPGVSGRNRAVIAARQRRRHWWAAASVGLVIAASAAVWQYQNRATPPASTPDPRRIAVLYFDDHSADQSLGHVASGLTESLIQELSRVRTLDVVSRNGVKPFRDGRLTTDSIARLLRVGSLVEGSIERSGDLLRVHVQFVNAQGRSTPIGSELVGPMGDLFLLEDSLAERVSATLRRTLRGEVRIREHVSETRSVRARELAWRADQWRYEADTLAGTRTLEGLRASNVRARQADSLLVFAEREDARWLAPVIDRGWVALQIAQRQSGAARDSLFAAARAHAERALSREPDNAAALELRGTLLYALVDRGVVEQEEATRYLEQAGRDLGAAIDRDSSLARAWGTLSRVRRAAGDVADAERKATIALEMDAYLEDAPSILFALFSATLMSDSLASAARWCEQGARAYPEQVGFVQCQLTLMAEDPSRPANPLAARRLLEQAQRLDPPELARARGRAWLPIYREMQYAVVLARARMRDSAHAIAARARAAVGNDRVMREDLDYEEALLALVEGRRSDAIEHLRAYLDARPFLTGLVARHPRWKPLRTDTAFSALTAAARQ